MTTMAVREVNSIAKPADQMIGYALQPAGYAFVSADWYTVMVTRSSALAKSNSIPATSLPISDVISEHCRSVAAHDCPAMPYWL